MECSIHQTYGRMRVRVASLKGNLKNCHDLIQELQQLAGVTRVAASDVTGTVVIHYNPKALHTASILRIFEQKKLLSNVIGFPKAHANPSQAIRPISPAWDSWVSDSVGPASRFVLKTLVENILQKTGQIIFGKIFG